eukprot:6456969-Amphidinium_carterae.1
MAAAAHRWNIRPPPGHVLLDVEGDGRCLYRCMALFQRTTWQEEHRRVCHELQNPSPQLQDAWHDTDAPQVEALRLRDDSPETPLPGHAWPGAQAVLAWAIACSCNVTVLTTADAVLEYSYGEEDSQRFYLAYNGAHYRPFCVKNVPKPALRKSRDTAGAFRNKLLG